MPKPRRRLASPRKPVKARNAKRRASEFTRCYGSRARVAWIQRQPCVVAGRGLICVGGEFNQNAHIESGGKGRKADALKIVPLCVRHHSNLHMLGRATFQALYAVDLEQLAAETELAWQVYRRAGSNTRRKLEQQRPNHLNNKEIEHVQTG